MKGLINDLAEIAKLEALYELEIVPWSPLWSRKFVYHDLWSAAVPHQVTGKTNINCSASKAVGGGDPRDWGETSREHQTGAGSLVWVRSAGVGFPLLVHSALTSVRVQ